MQKRNTLKKMETKLIKQIPHYLFNSIEEYRNFGNIKNVKNGWRKGNEGEWVYSDDKHVFQILKKSQVSHPSYKAPRTMIRTVCGTFICEQKTHKIIGEKGIAENIYTFSGNYKATYSRAKDRKLKNREFLFAQFVATGYDRVSAYKKAYPKSVNKRYIQKKSNHLLKNNKIRDMVGDAFKLGPEKNKQLEIEIGCTDSIIEYIYFIRGENTIKIGISKNPKQRLKAHQTSNSYNLEMIGYIKGNLAGEKRIQKCLEQHNIRGEWFYDCEEVRNYIDILLKEECFNG